MLLVNMVSVAADPIPEWAPYTNYTTGDLVTYGGATYQCIQSHMSLPGWEPANVPALWKLVGDVTPTPTDEPTVTPVTPTPVTPTPVTPTPVTPTPVTPTPPPDCQTYTSTDAPKDLPVGATSVSSVLYVGEGGEITDVNVSVDVSHGYVGDLILTLSHQETGQSVRIVDRPGLPELCEQWGCRGNDIVATLDDAASESVENQCAITRPTINGTFKPNEALSKFNGEDQAGTWVLHVEDAYPPDDGGTLNGWSVEICTGAGPTPTPVTPTPITPTPITPTPVTPTPVTPTPPPGDYRVIGYYPQWGIYARNFFIKNIDTSGSAEKLTHINYAFGNIVDGECIMVTQQGVMDAWADYQKGFTADISVSGVADTWDQPLRGNFNQLRQLKEKHPHLKVLISLGGWTWSGGFSDAAMTAASRQRVAQSCIDLYIKGNLPKAGEQGGPGVAAGIFDGIDIDWEYPVVCTSANPNCDPADKENFTLLLAEFRRQLDEIDPNLLLTIAGPAGEDKFQETELDKIHHYLDFINLMTYDFHGAWDSTGPTNFHSPLYASPNDPSTGIVRKYYADYAIGAHLDAGIPAHKLVMGVPFYGRGWRGVTNQNNGLYQSATGPAPGTYDNGVEDYKVLRNLNYPEYRDEQYTQAYWIFNGDIFWSFDDPVSMANKMNYIKAKGLGGAMIWALDGDTPNGELINVVHNGLNN